MNQIQRVGALAVISSSLSSSLGLLGLLSESRCSPSAPSFTQSEVDAAVEAASPILVGPVPGADGSASPSPSDRGSDDPSPDDAAVGAAIPDVSDGGAERLDAQGGGALEGGPDGPVVDARADVVPPLACSTGQTACAGQCVDLQTDPGHCGACQSACPAVAGALPVCAAGSCTFVCDATHHACGASCAGNADVSSCGTSCQPCPAGPPHSTTSCQPSSGGYACAAPCDAGYSYCGGACLDLQSDPLNCGACGHSCGPGTCGGGQCAPWVVASSAVVGSTVGLACDGTHLVWANDTTKQILEVPADGSGEAGGGVAPLALGTWPDPSFGGLAMAGSKVAWTSLDPSASVGFVWTATEGHATSTLGLQEVPNLVAGLALDAAGKNLYVNTIHSASAAGLWACDLGWSPQTSAASTPCVSAATFTSNHVGALAVDAAGVFWADPYNALVSHYLFANQSVSSIAMREAGVGPLALDASRVFWIDNAPGSFAIKATSKQAPTTPTAIATGTGTALTFATDGANLYAATGAGLVVSIPVAGGAIKPLYASGSGGGLSFMVYVAGAIYWADTLANTICGLRVP